MRVAAAALAIGGAAVAQPANHIGGPMAEILLTSGCEMKQSALSGAMKTDGWGISDFQAQSMALHNGGYLTSGDGGETLRLINWGACQ